MWWVTVVIFVSSARTAESLPLLRTLTIVKTPVRRWMGRSKYHDYYLDATTFERWEYVYDTNNMLVEVIAPDTSTWQESTYNSKGSVTAKRAGTGPWEYWTYEADGVSVATYTDAAGIVTEYDYDVDGRVSRVSHPSVHAYGYQYEYDANGNLAKETIK